MILIENIEIHAVHGCDHRCEQCSHFSNYALGGILSLDDADQYMGFWSHRLRPVFFSILGGEPTIHPQLTELVELACVHWPKVQLVTNGSFLDRHPRLPAVLEQYGVQLEISVHYDSPEYMRRVVEIKQLLNRWLLDYTFSHNIRTSFRNWRRTFRGEGSTLRPYVDGNPRESWNTCISKWCPQIHEGRLYKCPQIAYLPMLQQKLQLGAEWTPYLAYQPLDPGCPDDDLRKFITRTVEPICSMCPANPEPMVIADPLKR